MNAAPHFKGSPSGLKAIDGVLTCVLFLGVLFAPLALNGWGIGRDNLIMRRHEYRNPRPRPSVPRSAAAAVAFPWQWDDYWSDVFPYRGPLIQFQANVRHRTLGANGANSVILEDGSVFGVGNVDWYRGRNVGTDRDVDSFIEILRRKRAFFQKAGVDYYFLLAPSRLYFDRDRMDVLFRLPKRHALAEKIERRLPPDAREWFILPETAMRKAKERHPERPLFFKRDYHWSEWGRTVAASEIVRVVRTAHPDLPPLDPESVPIVVEPEDLRFWSQLRTLGVSFRAFPVPPTAKVAPAWTEEYERLAAARDRSPLAMAYYSDSFMEILSERPPEILSFGSVKRAGGWGALGMPAGCEKALAGQPAVVVESVFIDGLATWDYLDLNAAWLSDAEPRP